MFVAFKVRLVFFPYVPCLCEQYVTRGVIHKYGLKFGPTNSAMSYILPEERLDGFTKIYNGHPCFNGWAGLCRRYNLKIGDSVVCELELSGGVVAAVRVHFVKE